ncbi:MAG: LacI family DNA-binding transcriptional regulator [Deltaproteobacteria bacterium]
MVTLKEIASSVGVSTATVSRVLNFDTSLSITEGKRRAIIETAEALNYETPRARNRRGQPGVSKIALLHFLRPEQELIDPYYVALRLGIERRCQALQIEAMKVYHTEARPDLTLLQSAQGAIVVGRHSAAEVAYISQSALPLVFADFAPLDFDCDVVLCDLGQAMQKQLTALEAAGYARIAFIGWSETDGTVKSDDEKRLSAFRDWMAVRKRLDLDLIRIGGNSEQDGYRLTRDILAHTTPEAIVTCNDNMAVGAYRAIAERGLNIPGDIAVASFNDISAAQFLHPPLSTVHLPAEEIGETAVDLLVERIGGRDLAKQVTLASTLRWRRSTRPIPEVK